MTTDNLFNRWQAARRRPDVPGDFADRVMDRVRRPVAAPARPGRSARSVLASLAKAAAVLAASLFWIGHAVFLIISIGWQD